MIAPSHWRKLAATASIVLLLSVSVSKAGQNIGAGMLLLALILAGPHYWSNLLRHPLVQLSIVWVVVISSTTLYASSTLGISFQEQAEYIWRFSRLALIPLLAWGIGISGLGGYYAIMTLFGGFSVGAIYHVATSQGPALFHATARLDISGEGVQFYGLYSAVALIAALLLIKHAKYWLKESRQQQWHYLLCASVVITASHGLLISKARGAYLALAIMLIMLAAIWLLQYLQQQRSQSPRKPWRLLALALLITSVPAALYYSNAADSTLERVQRDLAAIQEGPAKNEGHFQETSMGIRLNVWQAGITQWQQQPWLGFGADGARYALENAALPERSAAAAEHHFHSNFIDILIRFGLIGSVSMLLFFGCYLVCISKSRGLRGNPLATFSLLSLTGFMVAGLTQTYWTSQVSWYFLAAILAPALASSMTKNMN